MNPKRVTIVISRKGRSLCIYPESNKALGSFMCSGPFAVFSQIQRSFNPHVNFCLEVLRIFLVTFFRLSIRKFHNDEDEMSLPSLVKKGFDHV